MTETRPPLEFPTEGEAQVYFRTHGDEAGRPYAVVGFGSVAASGPPRPALGWNAAGAWVWADEAEGHWP